MTGPTHGALPIVSIPTLTGPASKEEEDPFAFAPVKCDGDDEEDEDEEDGPEDEALLKGAVSKFESVLRQVALRKQ